MEKFIDASPAGFSANNTYEINSVFKLADILDKRVLKPDFSHGDKFPNIDGHIVIVNERQVQIGKLEVQIKTLPDKDLESPKFQCPVAFLSYSESASLPVLLIAVNHKSDKAFWLHIDRHFIADISKKIKGDTVSLAFPKRNVISRRSVKYIGDWKAIALEHLHKVIYYELLSKKHNDLQEKYDYLKAFPKPVHSIPKEDIQKLQNFIDMYNELISNRFPILKEFYYSKYWRIGIGYTAYDDARLSYLMYPIKSGENDLLIREIPRSKEFSPTDGAISWHTNNIENPIKKNAIRYAWEKVSKDVIEIVEKPLVKLVTEELASEFLINLIDSTYNILNVPVKDSYSISSILSRLLVLYPIWLEEAYNKKLSGEILFEYSNLYQLIEKDPKRVALRSAITLYRQQYVPNCQVKMPRYEADGEYLDASIGYFHSLNIPRIKRQYPANDYSKRKEGASFIWSFLTPEEIRIKADIIYQKMPKLLDAYVAAFLPALKNKITYFERFDLLVLNVRYNGQDGYQNGPVIEMYYFKSDAPVQGKIITYLNGEGCPVEWDGHWHKRGQEFDIEGNRYKLSFGGWTAAHHEFGRHALQDVLHDLAKEKIKNFFKGKLETLRENDTI